ncbi:MAG: hypothetical protein HGA76_03070 [Candidatus Firestonebacteria bacterium]|nr:hypothetical protein [Candidatus Firestonebacteria bacterium]
MASMTQWQKPRRSRWAKIISLCITVSFVLPYLTWAFEPAAYPASGHALTMGNRAFRIPAKLGTVLESHPGNGPLVVYVQDLHCNYEVQSNIAKIIDQLAQEQGLNLVAVEGASQPLDVSLLADYPSEPVKRKTVDYFVKQGKVTGAEMVAALGKHPISLEGVETPALYQDNYRTVMKILNDESQGYIYDLREALGEAKQRVYSPALRALDDRRTAFWSGELPLVKYAAVLAGLAARARVELKAYPNLALYVTRADGVFSETVDLEALNVELEALDRRLRVGLYTTENQRQLDSLEHRLDIMEKLLNISVSPEELAEFRARPETFQVKAFIDFLSRQKLTDTWAGDAELFGLDRYLTEAMRFYQVADQRSTAFVDNLQQRLAAHKTNLAMLITGGFHAAGVQAEMKQRGQAYVCIRPRLTHTDVVNPYFSILRNQPTPLEKLLAQNQNILSPVSNLAAKTDVLAPAGNVRALFTASVQTVRSAWAVLLRVAGGQPAAGIDLSADGTLAAVQTNGKATVADFQTGEKKHLALIVLPKDALKPAGTIVAFAQGAYQIHVGRFSKREIQAALDQGDKDKQGVLGLLSSLFASSTAASEKPVLENPVIMGLFLFGSSGWGLLGLILAWVLAPSFTSANIPGLRPPVVPVEGKDKDAKLNAGIKIENGRVTVRVMNALAGNPTEHYTNSFRYFSWPGLRWLSDARLVKELGYVQNALDRNIQAAGLTGADDATVDRVRSQVWSEWSIVLYAPNTRERPGNLPKEKEFQHADLSDPLKIRWVYQETAEKIFKYADGVVFTPPLNGLSLEKRALGSRLFGLFNEVMLAAKNRNEKFVFINTTPQGGGVAIMRHAMLRLLRLYGVQANWVVMGTPNLENFQSTKAYHNTAQGIAYERLTPEEIERLIAWNQEQLDTRFGNFVDQGSIIIVEDQQPAPMVKMIRERLVRNNPEARLYWRNHIQYNKSLIDKEGEPARDNYRNYVEPFVTSADGAFFHDKGTVPAGLETKLPVAQLEAAQPVTDGMDKPLSREELHRYWRQANELLEQTGQTPISLTQPREVQVSRFDPSKGLHILLDAFRLQDLALAEKRAKLEELHKRRQTQWPGFLRSWENRRYQRRWDSLLPQLIIAGNQAIDDPDFKLMYAAVLLKKRGAEKGEYARAIENILKTISDSTLQARKKEFYEATVAKFYDADMNVRAQFREQLGSRIKVIAAEHDDLFLNSVKRGFRLVEPGLLGAVRQRIENDKVIYLQMSEAEGFEHNLTEALAKGSVGITSLDQVGTSGLPRQIEAGITGFITDPFPKAAEQAAEFLVKLVLDPKLYFRMSRAALKVAPQNFTVLSNQAKIIVFDTLVVRIRHLIEQERGARGVPVLTPTQRLAIQHAMLSRIIAQVENERGGQYGFMPWLVRNQQWVTTMGVPEGWDWEAEFGTLGIKAQVGQTKSSQDEKERNEEGVFVAPQGWFLEFLFSRFPTTYMKLSEAFLLQGSLSAELEFFNNYSGGLVMLMFALFRGFTKEQNTAMKGFIIGLLVLGAIVSIKLMPLWDIAVIIFVFMLNGILQKAIKSPWERLRSGSTWDLSTSLILTGVFSLAAAIWLSGFLAFVAVVAGLALVGVGAWKRLPYNNIRDDVTAENLQTELAKQNDETLPSLVSLDSLATSAINESRSSLNPVTRAVNSYVGNKLLGSKFNLKHVLVESGDNRRFNASFVLHRRAPAENSVAGEEAWLLIGVPGYLRKWVAQTSPEFPKWYDPIISIYVQAMVVAKLAGLLETSRRLQKSADKNEDLAFDFEQAFETEAAAALRNHGARLPEEAFKTLDPKVPVFLTVGQVTRLLEGARRKLRAADPAYDAQQNPFASVLGDLDTLVRSGHVPAVEKVLAALQRAVHDPEFEQKLNDPALANMLRAAAGNMEMLNKSGNTQLLQAHVQNVISLILRHEIVLPETTLRGSADKIDFRVMGNEFEKNDLKAAIAELKRRTDPAQPSVDEMLGVLNRVLLGRMESADGMKLLDYLEAAARQDAADPLTVQLGFNANGVIGAVVTGRLLLDQATFTVEAALQSGDQAKRSGIRGQVIYPEVLTVAAPTEEVLRNLLNGPLSPQVEIGVYPGKAPKPFLPKSAEMQGEIGEFLEKAVFFQDELFNDSGIVQAHAEYKLNPSIAAYKRLVRAMLFALNHERVAILKLTPGDEKQERKARYVEALQAMLRMFAKSELFEGRLERIGAFGDMDIYVPKNIGAGSKHWVKCLLEAADQFNEEDNNVQKPGGPKKPRVEWTPAEEREYLRERNIHFQSTQSAA